MTKERTFTPPEYFPQDYVDGCGLKVTIYARGHGEYPLIGQYEDDGDVMQYDEGGHCGVGSEGDLHDIPKRITTWHNVYKENTHHTRTQADIYADYNRVCVYRIERDEDNGNLQIFVEDA